MPRQAAEACMICAPDPCECFAPKPKAKTPRKRPVEEVPLPGDAVEVHTETVAQPPRQDLRAKMKAAAAQAPAFQRVEQPVARRRAGSEGDLLTEGGRSPSGTSRPAPRPVVSDEVLLEHAALRALADIMHPDDRERYKMVINSTPSPAERKAEWRARRAWQLQQ